MLKIIQDRISDRMGHTFVPSTQGRYYFLFFSSAHAVQNAGSLTGIISLSSLLSCLCVCFLVEKEVSDESRGGGFLFFLLKRGNPPQPPHPLSFLALNFRAMAKNKNSSFFFFISIYMPLLKSSLGMALPKAGCQ